MPELATGDPIPERDRWEQNHAGDAPSSRLDGDVAGYTWAVPLQDTGYVRHVVIALPAHRGKGHGRAIMNEVAARLPSAGCKRCA
ncbi:MAG: GNAT family N-acetyltransferase [Polyangiaceae bacterium]